MSSELSKIAGGGGVEICEHLADRVGLTKDIVTKVGPSVFSR